MSGSLIARNRMARSRAVILPIHDALRVTPVPRFWGSGFSWQEGYGAFSVSPSQVPAIKNYIGKQEQHHRSRSFEDEFATLLHNCGIEYDARYVFG